MNSSSGRNGNPTLFTAPLVLLGAWLGIAFGSSHSRSSGTLWNYQDTTLTIGIVLGSAIAIAIWYAVKPSNRRWLMLIVLPAYAAIGIELGHLADKLLNWPNVGAVVGGMIGCVLGYVAGRAIIAASQPNAI